MSKFDEAIEAKERQERIDVTAALILASMTQRMYPAGISFSGTEAARSAYDAAEALEAERARRLGR